MTVRRSALHAPAALKLHLSAFALLLLLVAGPAAAKETITEEIDKTFRLQPGGEVILENINGHVRVEGWDQDRVELRITKKVKAKSSAEARKAMQELKVTIDSTAERLHVKTRKPESMEGMLGWLRNAGIEYQASYSLKVPRHVLLKARTVNGGVDVGNLNGDISARTTNGGIELSEVAGTIDASGTVSADTTNGRIKVAIHSVPPHAQMDFSTTNGAIEVSLPADIQTHLKARTTNGGISTDFPVKVEGKRNRRSIDTALNGGGDGYISLRTTNGGIKVREI